MKIGRHDHIKLANTKRINIEDALHFDQTHYSSHPRCQHDWQPNALAPFAMHFTIFTLANFAAVLSIVSPTFASEVTCNGDPDCHPANNRIARKLTDYINFIDPNRNYLDRELIACQKFKIDTVFESHVCAFVQKEGGAPGSSIRNLAQFIPDHGCQTCGSVPYLYPEGYGGNLTYNVVSDGACRDGLC
ncbi:hypothetical protein MMC07_005431 [Pseudocyphellaria aurata]|nr:hypothetical protein [Pseudocyphellaria aurata]